MRPLRPLLVVVLLLLGLLMLWPHPRAEEPSRQLPVQIRLQADLALRLIRLADLTEGELPPHLRANLEKLALAMLDQGLAHRPEDRDLLLRRALLTARAGNLPDALRLLSRIREALPGVSAIQRSWKGEEPAPDEAHWIRKSLDGYGLYLAFELTGSLEAAAALRPAEEARARMDAGLLGLLAGLTLASLSLGVLAWMALPWVARRHHPSGARLPPTRWLPLGALAFLLGFQVLVALVGGPLFSLLDWLGLSRVAAGVMTQILIYIGALTLLVRLLPRVARPEETCGPIPLLGLSRPGARDLLAGLIGFWMALPAVLTASWATSAVLGHSPFSSNPALEMILYATPEELAAIPGGALRRTARQPGPLDGRPGQLDALRPAARRSPGPAGPDRPGRSLCSPLSQDRQPVARGPGPRPVERRNRRGDDRAEGQSLRTQEPGSGIRPIVPASGGRPRSVGPPRNLLRNTAEKACALGAQATRRRSIPSADRPTGRTATGARRPSAC